MPVEPINYHRLIANHLTAAIREVSGEASISTPEQIYDLLAIPKNPKMGDIAFPCFQLAKSLRKAPPAIAKDLEAKCQEPVLSRYFSVIEAVGPYLNFTINKANLAEEIIPRILDGSFLAARPAKAERVMIEYSQPNTHKAFHVGHTRNVALGDALVRLFEWAGYPVIAANYIGDVGAHIAKCLWYYTRYFKGPAPQQNRGEFLGEMYVKATELLEFSDLTRAPYPGVVSAKVEAIAPHPHPSQEQPPWQIVRLSVGSRTATVVCGGTGFAVDDVVAYAPPGIRFLGREVLTADKGGIKSEGMICSESELGLSEERNRIFVFTPTTKTNQEIAEVMRNKDLPEGITSVVDEMRRREREVSEILQALEKHETKIYELWKETKDWSLQEFYAIYAWLNSRFDHYFFESEVAEAGKRIVKKGLDSGIFVRSEGAIGADLTAYQLPFFLLLKSDGTGLYSTKDLALAERKFSEFQIDRSIYVVDAGQSLHFQQVFKTLELLGYENAKKCYHLAYGKVETPDGKMSSRKGNMILFSQLKNLLSEKIMGEFLNKYIGDWSDEEITQACHRIAVATIKYGMLNQDNNKSIVFDLNEWTARTGNTGPYLLYAYARIRSILREAGEPPQTIQWATLTHDSEQELLRHMLRFPEVVESAVERYEPQMVCGYLYDLAKLFSRMYADCPVLRADSPELKWARLRLIDGTSRILKMGLELLGIQTLERM